MGQLGRIVRHHQASQTELQEVQALQEKTSDSSKTVLKLPKKLEEHQEDAKTARLEVVKLRETVDQLRAEVAKHQLEAKVAMQRAEEETAKAAEAESIMVAMSVEAESLNR